MALAQIEKLLEFNKSSRTLRAYAYLTASLRVGSAVDDALDCLVPFVAAGICEQGGSILDLEKLSKFLESFGLHIPLYVLESITGKLQHAGLLEWNDVAHNFLCVAKDVDRNIPGDDANLFDDAFDHIEKSLTEYAARHAVEAPPISATWADALITFLKSETASDVVKTVKIKAALVGDGAEVESFLVGSFIRQSEAENRWLFEKIVAVFTGVLIEDFIRNIQEVGPAESFKSLTIYYDTRVLLHLLGTSGRLLNTAALEMHRTLQDMGCRTLYFKSTESEVINILQTIVGAHAAGFELYGETAEALLAGEISINHLKDIEATFVDRLAHLNIFSYEYIYAARKTEDAYQIDETKFAGALESEALNKDRTYKRHNAEADAKAIAIIIRLRKGRSTRHIAECAHLFVTKNSLLQRVSKRFSQSNVEEYDDTSISPVLTVGQITTVAWLSTSKTLEPSKVGRELLAACYNAVKPSVRWTEEFSTALEEFSHQNPELAEKCAKSFVFLQAARHAAMEESLGQYSILRKLNMVATFQEAAKEMERQLREAEDRAAAESHRLATEAQKEGAFIENSRIRQRIEKAAKRRAKLIIFGLRAATTVVVGILGWWQSAHSDNLDMLLLVAVVALGMLSWVDLTGVPILAKPMRTLEARVRRAIESWMAKELIEDPTSPERAEPFL